MAIKRHGKGPAIPTGDQPNPGISLNPANNDIGVIVKVLEEPWSLPELRKTHQKLATKVDSLAEMVTTLSSQLQSFFSKQDERETAPASRSSPPLGAQNPRPSFRAENAGSVMPQRRAPTPERLADKGKAVAYVEGPPPPLGSLSSGCRETKASPELQSADWRRFKEAGVLDTAAMERRERQELANKVAKIEAGLYDYQHNMESTQYSSSSNLPPPTSSAYYPCEYSCCNLHQTWPPVTHSPVPTHLDQVSLHVANSELTTIDEGHTGIYGQHPHAEPLTIDDKDIEFLVATIVKLEEVEVEIDETKEEYVVLNTLTHIKPEVNVEMPQETAIEEEETDLGGALNMFDDSLQPAVDKFKLEANVETLRLILKPKNAQFYDSSNEVAVAENNYCLEDETSAAHVGVTVEFEKNNGHVGVGKIDVLETLHVLEEMLARKTQFQIAETTEDSTMEKSMGITLASTIISHMGCVSMIMGSNIVIDFDEVKSTKDKSCSSNIDAAPFDKHHCSSQPINVRLTSTTVSPFYNIKGVPHITVGFDIEDLIGFVMYSEYYKSHVQYGGALMDAIMGVICEQTKVDGHDVVVSWTSMIGGFAWNELCREAILHFLEMKGYGIKPNGETFISLVYACAGIGVSLSTLATSCSGCVCGSMPSWRKHFRRFGVTRKDQVSGEGSLVWRRYDHSVFVKGELDMLRSTRNVRVEAGWLFKGGDKGSDAISEKSESASEDILIFFFQLDLATRVQYALNVEEYDIAQQLRTKLAEVEAEVAKQEGKKGSSSKSEAQDKAISIIRLRADLQGAIESENYALAAKLRDDISKLETESLAVSAKALAHENAAYSFRLGQRVKHQKLGYSAIGFRDFSFSCQARGRVCFEGGGIVMNHLI